MRTVEDVLEALEAGAWLDHSARLDPGATSLHARCPAHRGRDANLSVFEGPDGRVAVKCHSHDCSTEDILSALGLWRMLKEAPAGTVRYEARLATNPTSPVGHHVVTHRGGQKKTVRWDPDGIKTPELALYRAWDVRPSDTTIVVCEGERATEAVIAAGLVAVGTQTGASAQPSDAALAILQGRDVVLWPDADSLGQAHMDGIARRLGRCRIVDTSDAPPKWDAADATTDDIRHSISRAAAYVPAPPRPSTRKESVATGLVRRSHEKGLALFCDREGVPYAADGRVVLPFAGGGVTDWLRKLAWTEDGRALSDDAARQAATLLETEARCGGQTEEVHLRVGPVPGGGIAIDLGTAEWTAAVARATGWTMEPHPVRFRRPRGTGSLPAPMTGARGSELTKLIEDLLKLDSNQAVLVVGFLIGALAPRGPYAHLGLTGPQGAAKSFRARLIRSLIDPVAGGTGVKGLTRSDEGFWTHAYHSWLPAFDNISGMSAEQSDLLAQLATGSGRTARRLYSDGDEFAQVACRPAIVNGIELAERPDLLSRTIMLDLPPIEGGYTVESRLLAEFSAIHPRALGALLDAMVGLMERLDQLPEAGWKARMADHVRWVTAAEPALGWPDRSYEARFVELQDRLMVAAGDGVVWLPDLHQVLQRGGGRWEGGAAELFDQLRTLAQDAHAGRLPDAGHGWPKSAKGMADALKRHATVLRAAGILHRTEEDAHTKRHIHVLEHDPASTAGAYFAPTLGGPGSALGITSVGAGVAGVAGLQVPSVTTNGGQVVSASRALIVLPQATPDQTATTPATPASPAAVGLVPPALALGWSDGPP
jgi:hypothetical protein